MKAVLDIKPILLAPRSMHRIENGKGTEVLCLQGAVWITQEGDPRDIVLSPGQSFVVDRRGVAVVYALKEAAITVGTPGHVSPAPAPRRAA
ncbi:MAG TPA: DUF2917 domain-containing protein [Hyphomicrobiaceae bacterium]|nr:DUF2917 domain-containing protein [Hyphomicrobiaceae bacterium]